MGTSLVDLENLYNDLVNDVRNHEQNVKEYLPSNSISEVHEFLTRPPRTWKSGVKSLRTLAVVNAYEAHLGVPISDELKKSLLGLDANINALDDIIDTQNPEKEEKVEMTAVAAFTPSLFWQNIPTGYQQNVGNYIIQYLTELFQIPKVEAEALQTIREAETKEQARIAARRTYNYRARDINAMAEITGLIHKDSLSQKERERVISDLHTYRARGLLRKDIKDVERDLDDGDFTPVLAFMKKYDNPATMTEEIRVINDAFSYIEGTAHQPILTEYEDSLDNLIIKLEDKMELLIEER